MSDKAPGRPLHAMFAAVPPRYDLVNRVITFGLDNRWRLSAARLCLANRPRSVLDLCCGTGDLAILIARLVKKGVEITGVDYSQPMLDIAGQKAIKERENITFISGDAANLPFPDNNFDSVGISFAFRNLTYKNPLAERHLAEALRVLRPAGRFVIVESSQPENKLINQFYRWYLRYYVANIGRWFSGNRAAYHYLAESAARYYRAGELKELLLDAGFSHVSYQYRLFGAVAIHVAIK